MGRYLGPKFKLDRREGTNLFLKGKRSLSPKHPIEKKGAVPPGQHGQRSLRRKFSDYGLQLREKQKVKRMYGLLERQFRKYYKEAAKKKGETGVALLQKLETRLDNVIYRLGFTMSRAQARQLVSHRHVLVNEKKVNIPSYAVKIGEVVTISDKAQKFNLVKEAHEIVDKESLPKWLEKKGLSGKMKRLPDREEIGANINDQLIVEFYSR
ncbi:MAG: 30S ribosomal protein S4 [Candidatus Woykebacteria bacterium]